MVSFLFPKGNKAQNNEISKAHERSAFAIIDPLYKVSQTWDLKPGYFWLYRQSLLECWPLEIEVQIEGKIGNCRYKSRLS